MSSQGMVLVSIAGRLPVSRGTWTRRITRWPVTARFLGPVSLYNKLFPHRITSKSTWTCLWKKARCKWEPCSWRTARANQESVECLETNKSVCHCPWPRKLLTRLSIQSRPREVSSLGGRRRCWRRRRWRRNRRTRKHQSCWTDSCCCSPVEWSCLMRLSAPNWLLPRSPTLSKTTYATSNPWSLSTSPTTLYAWSNCATYATYRIWTSSSITSIRSNPSL